MKIYLDAGHNPTNPNAGAEGNGYREQDLVYEIARQTGVILRQNGLEVRLSRPTPETQLGTSNASSHKTSPCSLYALALTLPLSVTSMLSKKYIKLALGSVQIPLLTPLTKSSTSG